MWELIPCSFLLTGPDGLSELAPPPPFCAPSDENSPVLSCRLGYCLRGSINSFPLFPLLLPFSSEVRMLAEMHI